MKTKITILGTLMMAVIITSYSVSGTYAKYVSEIDLADEARVAKWEIGLETDAMKTLDLFQVSYEYVKNGGNTVVALPNVDTTTDNVVAPGTRGQYTFALTGTIETNYRINVTATGSNTVKTIYEGNEYDPIKFYVSEQDNLNIDDVDAADLLTFDELLTSLNALYSGTADKVYAPGEVNVPSYTIYWKWDFAGADTIDKADTTLGEEIAADTTSHKINLSINIKAEQTTDAAN